MHSHTFRSIHSQLLQIQPPNLRQYPEGRRRLSFDAFDVMVHNYREVRRAEHAHMHVAREIAHDAQVWAKRHHSVRAADLFHDAAKVLDTSTLLVGPSSSKSATLSIYLHGSADHYRLALLDANLVTSALPPPVYLRAAELHATLAKHDGNRGPVDLYNDLAARTRVKMMDNPSFAARVKIVELQYGVIELAYSGDVAGAQKAAGEIVSLLPEAQKTLLPGSKRRHFDSLLAWFEHHAHEFAKHSLEFPRLS